MKKYLSLISGIIAVMMVTTLSAQNTQDGIAKVVSLKGAGRYMTGAGTDWKPIKVGMVLKPGTVIQTAADSYVDIVLNNAKASQGLGSALSDEEASMATTSTSAPDNYKPKAIQDAIRIFENSVLSVDKLTVTKTGADVVSETQLDLKAGKIFGTVKKLSAASIYEVKVPNGVAGIRGTIYLIGADGSVNVLTGAVVMSFVFNGAVITKEVPAGFQFVPTTGQVIPITNPLLKQLIRLAQIFSKYIQFPPTTIFYDHTIYNVSPVNVPGGTGGTGGTGNTGVGAGDGGPP